MQVEKSNSSLLQEAAALEQQQQLNEAAGLYEQVISSDHLNEEAYDRLMIIYRKLKEYNKELKTIEAGIKAFQQFYKQKISKSKKIQELSNKLMKSTGLADKKGNVLYTPEPIARWQKRKAVVEKKIR